MDVLIGWLHPNVVIKWIMGFALAAYVAIPNYGLLQESSIPDDKQTQAHDDFLATTGHLCGFGNRSATAILVRGQDGCLLSSLVPRL
jgi:hypothetical protein